MRKRQSFLLDRQVRCQVRHRMAVVPVRCAPPDSSSARNQRIPDDHYQRWRRASAYCRARISRSDHCFIPDCEDQTPPEERAHSHQITNQADRQSIKTFRWTFPILLDGNDRIIAGHARFEAAKLLGLTDVPIIRRSDMSEAQLRAYCIADNKLAERAGWDTALLKLEFE